METVGWEHLLVGGGILDQPEWLWQDLQIISWRRKCVENMLKGVHEVNK